MGRYDGRIRALEQRLGGDGCRACGRATGTPTAFVFGGERRRGEPFDPCPCAECGRPTRFTLDLGDPAA